MVERIGQRPRDGGPHWLPSQGVDPAPLLELNAECLGLLVLRAADAPAQEVLPPLLARLRSQWAALPAQAGNVVGALIADCVQIA